MELLMATRQFGEFVRHLVAEPGPFVERTEIVYSVARDAAQTANFLFDALTLYSEPTRKIRPSPKGPIVRSTSTAMRVRPCREWPPP